ncbi:MAG: hypothetical protein JWM83_1229 [Candidatus Angelobacter sp.]|nr:hypothetical protein [Candidatus Angelobacter sp.]
MSESGMNGAGIGVNEAATEADEVRKRKFRQEWEQTGGGQLCLAFYEAFNNYKEYLEIHSGETARPGGPINNKYEEHSVFQECLSTLESYKREREETLRRNLEKAQQAARCEHQFLSGEQCRAPRVRVKQLCRMHEGMEEAKAVRLDLGPMEDADSIQVGIRKLQAAIIDGKLDSKQIGHLAYTIQLAAWNVTRTTTLKVGAE